MAAFQLPDDNSRACATKKEQVYDNAEGTSNDAARPQQCHGALECDYEFSRQFDNVFNALDRGESGQDEQE
jgi:hypothetical protein